jgi:hypothetical protein
LIKQNNHVYKIDKDKYKDEHEFIRQDCISD